MNPGTDKMLRSLPCNDTTIYSEGFKVSLLKIAHVKSQDRITWPSFMVKSFSMSCTRLGHSNTNLAGSKHRQVL